MKITGKKKRSVSADQIARLDQHYLAVTAVASRAKR